MGLDLAQTVVIMVSLFLWHRRSMELDRCTSISCVRQLKQLLTNSKHQTVVMQSMDLLQ